MNLKHKPQVNAISPADSASVQAHYGSKLGFETDCWDVHFDISHNIADFVLVDVRSPTLYRQRHAIGAINIPHSSMTKKRMDEYPPETKFVVYCAGPGCNGADKGALKLSQLSRPVKIMIGGLSEWVGTENFPTESSE